ISVVGQFTSFALSLSKGDSRFDKLTASGFHVLYDTPVRTRRQQYQTSNELTTAFDYRTGVCEYVATLMVRFDGAAT
ncbi:MAG: hypothetical protein OXK79_09715, partial [Chloroflexota bacterium]|nr:hypothetical protein [Chloroflexota bacterium]